MSLSFPEWVVLGYPANKEVHFGKGKQEGGSGTTATGKILCIIGWGALAFAFPGMGWLWFAPILVFILFFFFPQFMVINSIVRYVPPKSTATMSTAHI